MITNSRDIKSRIIILAIPAVLTQIINTIYSIVDRIFIGKIPGIGTSALSGLGVCFPIIILITAFLQLVGVGTSTLLAMMLGKRDKAGAERVVGNAIILLFTSLLFVFFLLNKYKYTLLITFGASYDTIVFAEKYLNIYLYGIFFQGGMSLFSYIMICQYYAKKSMTACAISVFINIVLDYILMRVFNWGIEGAAIASVIAQAIGLLLIIGLYYSIRDDRKIRIKKKEIKYRLDTIRLIITYGFSSFAMTMTEVFIHAAYNKSLQIYGSDRYIAVMTIIQSFMQLIYVFSNGLTQATQPTISYFYGANEKDFLKAAIHYTMKYHLIIACGLSSILIVFRRFFSLIYTADENVINNIYAMLPLYLAGWWIFGIQSGTQCVLVGLGKVMYSLQLACVRKIVLLIPLIIIMPIIVGVKGIFLAEAIADGISGIIAWYIFKRKVIPILDC